MCVYIDMYGIGIGNSRGKWQQIENGRKYLHTVENSKEARGIPGVATGRFKVSKLEIGNFTSSANGVCM